MKIDSSNVSSYYNAFKTSFLNQLSEPVSCINGESILYSLISATIPYSFYGLNKWNCNLDIRETINNLPVVRTVIIPHGNYDAIWFLKTLVQLLNTVNHIYSIVYNKINHKFNIKINTIGAKSLFLFGTGVNKEFSCYALLGLS